VALGRGTKEEEGGKRTKELPLLRGLRLRLGLLLIGISNGESGRSRTGRISFLRILLVPPPLLLPLPFFL
jgi:hypothetical protein